MATNGYTDAYVTDYDTLRFEWYQVSQSIENNTTTIKWYLYLISGAYGAINSSPLKSGAVNINGGENIGHSVSVEIGNKTTKTLATGEKTITHNSDGTKTFNYSFYQDFDITFSGTHIGTVSGSGSGTLEQIARFATLNSATDFTDEEKPTITYSNPAGNAVTSLQAAIAFESSSSWKVVPYREISKTAGRYTFSLTDGERYNILHAIPAVKEYTMVFFLACTIGGITKVSTKKAKITVVNAAPTITPIVEDYGSDSYSLTGNRDVIIKGFNHPKVKFQATAKKQAWIKSKTVKCNGITYTPISDDSESFEGYFNNVESATFEFSVTDSRGFTTTQTVTKTLVNHFNPTINVDYTTAINSSTNTSILSIKASGKCYSGSFGGNGEANEIYVYHRYKTNNESYNGWTMIDTITASDNKYSKNFVLMTSSGTGTPSLPRQFNLGDIITLQCIVTDLVNPKAFDRSTHEPLPTAIYIEKKIVIQPVFDWSKSDFAFHVPVSVKGISIGGGELIGYGMMYNNTYNSNFAIATGSSKSWSDLNYSGSGTSNTYETYVDTSILTVQDGIFLVYPNNIVGMVEVEVVLSGLSDAHCYGLWWKGNSNTLPTGVSLLGFGSSDNTNGALSHLPNNGYGSVSHRYIYSVNKTTSFSSSSSFYINPTFMAYGYNDSTTGYFRPNDGGTKSYMIIKIYSKRGV